MEFLGIDKKAISNFQLLLLQTEVRAWHEWFMQDQYNQIYIYTVLPLFFIIYNKNNGNTVV